MSLWGKLVQQFTEKSTQYLTPVWTSASSAACGAVKGLLTSLPKSGAVGKITDKVGSAVVGAPGLASRGLAGCCNSVYNVTENKVGPALLTGAEHVKDVGCKCRFTTRHWLAQQLVCYGRRMHQAPGEAKHAFDALRTGDITYAQLTRGTGQAGIITALFYAPTVVLLTLAQPSAGNRSYVSHGHGGGH